ncbi:phosphatidate cytidylyltransferase [Nocardioides albertanoniae]|uniref:Phosphatidate cytidylyltransferase n=1 Tax=Nocardioides albertanoniae TaxID=1175486 RepID=A0A543A9S9_9ACTN|nr:phosphatidate cytidylyltransferase [Nocardioides albertanoniae]TQL69367.1 phosphatidate cytidylyltransferase [Nocardioides albertanoniae]
MTEPQVSRTPPSPSSAASEPPKKDYGRAGRNLPAAIGSAVVLLVAIALSLMFVKTAFMVIVVACVVAAVWELHRGLVAKDMDVPEQPLMIGGTVMVLVAYFLGSDALVTATAVSALVIMLWVLRRGVDGYVRTSAASVLTLLYIPFLGSFVGLMLGEGGGWTSGGFSDDGVLGIIVWVLLTIMSDIGGYIAGVLFGKHAMAPVISPKKSWEGFAGSVVFTVATGIGLVVWLLDGSWWIGVALGVVACVMAVLGDLVESVIKRDLGVKDMSQIIPGHGGLMDRLDSLLATVAPVWLILHYAVF